MPGFLVRPMRSTLDPHALSQFLVRSQGQLTRMQALLTSHSPLVDVRNLQPFLQGSRSIAAGAEVAGLWRIARAAEDVEGLAAEAARSSAPDSIGFAVRMADRLRELGARIESALRADGVG